MNQSRLSFIYGVHYLVTATTVHFNQNFGLVSHHSQTSSIYHGRGFAAVIEAAPVLPQPTPQFKLPPRVIHSHSEHLESDSTERCLQFSSQIGSRILFLKYGPGVPAVRGPAYILLQSPDAASQHRGSIRTSTDGMDC